MARISGSFHRLGRRRHHGEAAARAGLAGEIDGQRGGVDARQPLAHRHLLTEDIDHPCARVFAIALVALDVNLLFVAEGGIEARPVHTGGGAEIVERGRGIARLRNASIALARAASGS